MATQDVISVHSTAIDVLYTYIVFQNIILTALDSVFQSASHTNLHVFIGD